MTNPEPHRDHEGETLGPAGLDAAGLDAGEHEVAEEPAIERLPGGLRAALEAVLMVADEPLTEVKIAAALQVPAGAVHDELRALSAAYDEERRGFELARAAGGWRFYSRAIWAPVVGRLVLDGQTARLSKAALETLAVIAYRQPVSRTRVAAVRGVSVDAVFRTLRTRGLIDEVDTDELTGAVRYGTTGAFLELMGLQSVAELPPLAPLLPDLDEVSEHL